MTGQVLRLPSRPRPGLGAYPYEVGVKPVSDNPPRFDGDRLAELFDEMEEDEMAPSRGVVNAVLISVPCFVAIAIGVMLALWL